MLTANLPTPIQEIDPDLKYRWSQKKSNDWYKKNGWIVGCNYIPSTAINQLEMWQPDTFDIFQINKELGWAHDLGFNTIRVFLHHLLWEQDSSGFLDRMEKFLAVADSHGIKTMFVFFDAVWDPYPKLGKQPEPKLNVHNSGWVQSPGAEILRDTKNYDILQEYVQGVVNHFKNDTRVLIWDLFNEPDNLNLSSYNDTEYEVHKAELSMQLLKRTIQWVRAINPVQPLTAAPWQNDWSDPSLISAIDNYMFSHSDVITFHCYEQEAGMEKRILALKRYKRPLICTEYMARQSGCTFEAVLPVLKRHHVGAYNWGFVAGKTQTHFPWDSWGTSYNKEPELWFHDIFRENGQPYDYREVQIIKSLTGKAFTTSYEAVA